MKKGWLILLVALLAAPQVLAQEADKATKDDGKAQETKRADDAAPAQEEVENPASEPQKEEAGERRAPTAKADSSSGNQGAQSKDDEGERFPHGSRWSNGVYGASGWWASVHVGGGLSLIQVNEAFATSGSQITSGFSIGSTLHASHLWALSLDVSMSSVNLTDKEALQADWDEFKASNMLVTVGAKVYPWAHEYCSVALGAHAGFNQYNSSVKGSGTEASWGGPELVAGGTVEMAYFPMHALEIAANVRVDALLGGDNSAESEWLGTGAPSSMRLVVGANLMFGFHF